MCSFLVTMILERRTRMMYCIEVSFNVQLTRSTDYIQFIDLLLKFKNENDVDDSERLVCKLYDLPSSTYFLDVFANDGRFASYQIAAAFTPCTAMMSIRTPLHNELCGFCPTNV